MIVYLMRNKVKKYQEKLIDELSKKFKINNLNHHIPAHITLKVPFETKRIKNVENVLRNFVKKQKQSKIKVKGFGSFNGKVIFINPIYSNAAKILTRNLIKDLEIISRMKLKKYDKDHTPHATIGYARNKYQFKEILNFLNSKNPEFSMSFDNITILKKVVRNWKIYKIFKIR